MKYVTPPTWVKNSKNMLNCTGKVMKHLSVFATGSNLTFLLLQLLLKSTLPAATLEQQPRLLQLSSPFKLIHSNTTAEYPQVKRVQETSAYERTGVLVQSPVLQAKFYTRCHPKKKVRGPRLWYSRSLQARVECIFSLTS